MTKNVSLTINGQKITVPEDYFLIQAARELNIEIPALCYDPDLEVVAACRLCLVEIEGSRKLETSCSVKVREGMSVNTESEKVVKARREILQLLLDSHPNDCLTCQKAGECLLQKYSYKYNVKFREHNGVRREQQQDNSSPYILKDNSKCILCGKCVRTCSQVKEEREVLSFAGRGYDTQIVLDDGKNFEKSKCVSCSRCVAVCPVGALVDKRLMGKTRIWDADVKTVNCKVCPYGCEFEVISENNKNIAVRAKTPSQGRPLCLKGRLTTELMYVQNPDKLYRKIGDRFVESDWSKALGLTEIMGKIDEIDKRNKIDKEK